MKLNNEYWFIESFNMKKQFILSNVKIYQAVFEFIQTKKKGKILVKAFFLYQGRVKNAFVRLFFLSTLDISHGSVDNAFSKKDESGIFTGEDGRGLWFP